MTKKSREPVVSGLREAIIVRELLRGAWEAADAFLASCEAAKADIADAAAEAPSPPAAPPPAPEPPPPAPVELPDRFPATLVEAVAQSLSVGATPEFVKKVWEQAVARGGRDSKDVQIRSWSHHVSACLAYEREAAAKAKAAKTAPGGDSSVWELKQALEAKQAERDELRNKYAFEQPDRSWKWEHMELPEVKTALAKAKLLGEEIKALRAKIGASVTA